MFFYLIKLRFFLTWAIRQSTTHWRDRSRCTLPFGARLGLSIREAFCGGQTTTSIPSTGEEKPGIAVNCGEEKAGIPLTFNNCGGKSTGYIVPLAFLRV